MKTKGFNRFLICVFMVMFATGCVSVKSYKVDKDRLDQNIEGNQGTLMGEPDELGERKKTRATYVTEVEVAKPRWTWRWPWQKKEEPVEEIAESEELTEDTVSQRAVVFEERTPEVSLSASSVPSVTYKVKKNDTLQKISLKFYGTTRKWKKIYNANRGSLKAPDRIYSGQILTIPGE